MTKEELINSLKTLSLTPYYFEEIDSTNTYAKSALLTDSSIVIAEYQTAGRGRFNRHWLGDPGKNVLVTIVKKMDVELHNSYLINFYTSYIVLETLKLFIRDAESISLKWPNDVLIKNKKVAGILSEVFEKKFIIGVGINVNQVSFPEELKDKASSLFLVEGKEVSVNSVIYSFAEKFLSALWLLKMPVELMKMWKSAFHLEGREITYSITGGERKTAIIVGVDDDGGLVVTEEGVKKKYYTGEITDFRG
ncbi:MAG: biotin--[acetyl-CoA-carboxylase] ligase [Ignavibacteria bacterium]